METKNAQAYFLVEIKKTIISLLSAEFAQKEVKVKYFLWSYTWYSHKLNIHLHIKSPDKEIILVIIQKHTEEL